VPISLVRVWLLSLSLGLGILTAALAPATPASSEALASAAPESLKIDFAVLINNERTAAGLAPLTLADDRTMVAQARALDMANGNYFAHVNGSGIGPIELFSQFQIQYGILGENIARCDYPSNQALAVVHAALMASESHRANVLNPRFHQVGIGVAVVGAMYYFSVIFTD
jgi:uncharacterized protein YkwD